MKPLISIVIPVYNLQDYIEKTLDSVFSQTYPNIEVIAVNDGSKDNSAHILDEYAKKETRLKVIHKENGGVTKARITGIKAASGEYIGFVDGDDLIDADMYERLMNNLLKYNVDISHCGYRRVNYNGNVEYYYNTGCVNLQERKKGLEDLLRGTLIEPGLWNKLFAKKLFNKILNEDSIMDFSFKENEDLLMNYCLFCEAEISVFEDFCPYQYIIRNSSASHGKVNRNILEDPIFIGEKLIEDTKNDMELNLLSSRYYVVKLIRAATMSYHNCRDLLPVRKNARKKLRKFVFEYIKISGESFQRKIFALFAAFLPDIYNVIHKMYI